MLKVIDKLYVVIYCIIISLIFYCALYGKYATTKEIFGISLCVCQYQLLLVFNCDKHVCRYYYTTDISIQYKLIILSLMNCKCHLTRIGSSSTRYIK